MQDLFSSVFANTGPVGSIVSPDSLIPLAGVLAAITVAVVQAFAGSREKVHDIQNKANERRIEECEQLRDQERRKHELCQQALSMARVRIAELEDKYEGGRHDADAHAC